MQQNITLHSKSVKPQPLPRTDRWYKICCLSHAVVCAVRRCFSLFYFWRRGLRNFHKVSVVVEAKLTSSRGVSALSSKASHICVSLWADCGKREVSKSLSTHGVKLFIDLNFVRKMTWILFFNFTPSVIFAALWNDSTICNLLLC